MSSRNSARLPVRVFLLGAILLLGTADIGRAQNGASSPVAQAADSAGFESTASAGSTTSTGLMQGLPRRAPQPRTLHDFWPAFVALALLWSTTVAFVLGFNRSLGRIAARMQAAEGGSSDEAR